MGEEERPGEEGEECPVVEDLRDVECGNVVGFVAQDNAAVVEDEAPEKTDKGQERKQGANDGEEPSWSHKGFQSTRPDRDKRADVVYRK